MIAVPGDRVNAYVGARLCHQNGFDEPGTRSTRGPTEGVSLDLKEDPSGTPADFAVHDRGRVRRPAGARAWSTSGHGLDALGYRLGQLPAVVNLIPGSGDGGYRVGEQQEASPWWCRGGPVSGVEPVGAATILARDRAIAAWSRRSNVGRIDKAVEVSLPIFLRGSEMEGPGLRAARWVGPRPTVRPGRTPMPWPSSSPPRSAPRRPAGPPRSTLALMGQVDPGSGRGDRGAGRRRRAPVAEAPQVASPFVPARAGPAPISSLLRRSSRAGRRRSAWFTCALNRPGRSRTDDGDARGLAASGSRQARRGRPGRVVEFQVAVEDPTNSPASEPDGLVLPPDRRDRRSGDRRLPDQPGGMAARSLLGVRYHDRRRRDPFEPTRDSPPAARKAGAKGKRPVSKSEEP